MRMGFAHRPSPIAKLQTTIELTAETVDANAKRAQMTRKNCLLNMVIVVCFVCFLQLFSKRLLFH